MSAPGDDSNASDLIDNDSAVGKPYQFFSTGTTDTVELIHGDALRPP